MSVSFSHQVAGFSLEEVVFMLEALYASKNERQTCATLAFYLADKYSRWELAKTEANHLAICNMLASARRLTGVSY